jgi:hypothetical protein
VCERAGLQVGLGAIENDKSALDEVYIGEGDHASYPIADYNALCTHSHLAELVVVMKKQKKDV